MADQVWSWLGDIHQVAPQHWVGVIVTTTSVLCGGLIGMERSKARKPVGLRTLILICLGSAIFTQASLLISDHPLTDRGRIAAQVVTGVGFLGAGAIIRERGLLIGITTGAGIWATAAVGVVLGAGYVAAGIFFSLVILGTLAAERAVDRLLGGSCEHSTLELTFDPGDGKTAFRIQAILDEYQSPATATFKEPVGSEQQATIRYCHAHREHRAFLRPLLSLDRIHRVSRS
jgi:putative Mg2+ transporter-C (MgtC) family protein